MTIKYKYYVGVKPDKPFYRAIIFRSHTEPTNEVHPLNVRFVFGDYCTRAKAEQIAMYQNYVIDNDWQKDIPIWSGKHNEDVY